MAATKPKTHRYYRESNTAIDECGVLVRPALLMIEGVVTDSLGQKTTYTRELIDAIVEASNTYSQNNEIKLFNDHEYSQESRIGAVTGVFSAREITDLDIPQNGDRSVIGKYAIFNDGLEIRSDEAIEQYHSGLLKELSIGLDLKGSIFGENVIYEVSAVPFPAVAEAHIYSKGEKPMETTNQYAFTFAAAKRMGDNPTNYEMADKHYSAMNAFSRCMANIENATDAELPKSKDKMKKNAINDLHAHLCEMHLPQGGQVPDEQDLTPPVVQHGKPMEDTQQYSAEVLELRNQVAKLQKDNQDTLKFSALKDRASELVRNGKLTPAEYKNKFEGSQAFANYQTAIAGDPLESFLNYLDAHVTPDSRLAPSVYGATPLANQDVPERPESEQKDLNERIARHAQQLAKASYR